MPGEWYLVGVEAWAGALVLLPGWGPLQLVAPPRKGDWEAGVLVWPLARPGGLLGPSRAMLEGRAPWPPAWPPPTGPPWQQALWVPLGARGSQRCLGGGRHPPSKQGLVTRAL